MFHSLPPRSVEPGVTMKRVNAIKEMRFKTRVFHSPHSKVMAKLMHKEVSSRLGVWPVSIVLYFVDVDLVA